MIKYALVGLLASMVVACSSIPQQSAPEWVGYTQTGEASFYAMKYQFCQ